MAAPTSLISDNHIACIQSFDNLFAALNRPSRNLAGPEFTAAAQNEFGRYKVWAGNVGAAHRGRAHRLSLDYRLKDASFYRDRVLELLTDLHTTLQKATSLLHGARLPFEEQDTSAASEIESDVSSLQDDLSGESSESDSDEDDGKMGMNLKKIRGVINAMALKPSITFSEPKLPMEAKEHSEITNPTTEIGHIQLAIKDIVTSLYKLAIVIRRPLPSDRHEKSMKINIQHFAEFDHRYVCDKFPEADPEIIARLGRGITRRRQLLKYRELHNERMQLPVKPEPTEPSTAPRVGVEMNLRFLQDTKSKVYSSNLNPSTQATTFVPKNPIVIEEVQSVADTASSYQSTLSGQEVISIPPRPRGPDGEELEELECPYCHVLCEIKSSNAWKHHVLRDLEPYMCVYPGCSKPDQMYANRSDWREHDLGHKVEWFCNIEGHTTYRNLNEFKSHMVHSHGISGLLDGFRRPLKLEHEACPLCKGVTTNMESHLAHHLTQLALFAVPHADYADGGSDVESTASARAQIHSTDSEQSSLPFGAADETGVSNDTPVQRTFTETPADLKLEDFRSLQSVQIIYALVTPSRDGELETYISESVSKRLQLIGYKDGKVAITWMSSEGAWKISTTSCVVRPDHELPVDIVFGTRVIDEVASPATDRPRVMTTIRGYPYDITDLGIDADFLAELPDDFREEIVIGAVVEMRSQAVATGDLRGVEGTVVTRIDLEPPIKHLQEAIRTGNGPLETENVRQVMLQLVDAVSDMHQKGIYHRDLKAENISIFESGNISIKDSGCGTSEKWTYETVGSDQYMSPEQYDCAGAGYAPDKADIWAIGIILLNILFSRSPFTRPSESDPLFLGFSRDKQTLFDVFPIMSQDTYEVLAQCMSLDPRRRSLKGTRDALQRVVRFTTIDESLDDFRVSHPPAKALVEVGIPKNGKPLQTPSIQSTQADTRSFPGTKPFDASPPQQSPQLSAIPEKESYKAIPLEEDKGSSPPPGPSITRDSKITSEIVATSSKISVSEVIDILSFYERKIPQALPVGGIIGSDNAYDLAKPQFMDFLNALSDFTPLFLPPNENQPDISLKYLEDATEIIHRLPEWDSQLHRHHKNNAYAKISRAWGVVINKLSMGDTQYQESYRRLLEHHKVSGRRMVLPSIEISGDGGAFDTIEPSVDPELGQAMRMGTEDAKAPLDKTTEEEDENRHLEERNVTMKPELRDHLRRLLERAVRFGEKWDSYLLINGIAQETIDQHRGEIGEIYRDCLADLFELGEENEEVEEREALRRLLKKSVPDHEDSEDEVDDVDEEARLVTLLGPDTPQLPINLDAWLAERRSRFPTKARRVAAAEELRLHRNGAFKREQQEEQRSREKAKEEAVSIVKREVEEQSKQKKTTQTIETSSPPAKSSEEAKDGAKSQGRGVPPLPSCPRATFVRGYGDWLTLPQSPPFDICPSCFNSVIAPTAFRSYFMPSPTRPQDTKIRCDFGATPWYRIAWLLTQNYGVQDLKLFYELANIAERVSPCPGRALMFGECHSIIDSETGSPMVNFAACSKCVKSVEVLLPANRGIFVPGLPLPRWKICDLRFDSNRFTRYFDAIQIMAERAKDRDEVPDTTDLQNLIRRFALIPECQRDAKLGDSKWHIIPGLPNFTVCEDCFDNFVCPLMEVGNEIPFSLDKNLYRYLGASCQLYPSSNMRHIFKYAVDTKDFGLLVRKVREREEKIELVRGP